MHPARGTWHDFEADAGGGALALIEHVNGCDKAGLAWLVDGMTYKRCRFVEEYTMIRRRYRDIRNAALAYRLAGYAPRWSTVLGPKLRRVPCVAWAIHWKTERIRARLAGGSVT